jgi:4-amino-4-deoxy-L-arabinose transferase-like glycosyltransferase
MPVDRTLVAQRLGLPAVLAVCAAVYWAGLGWTGFAQTEGHRVAPAWGMVESGDWLRQEMFGAPYLRKPPGMTWAIAASSALLGQTEFAARAPSALAATLMAVLAYVFAARWFGRPWGVAAGLAQALLPVMWAPGRSAEIEALHLLTTQASVFCLIEVVMGPAKGGGRGAWGWVVSAGVAIGAMVTVKGPAGLPCVAGVLGAAYVGRRGARVGVPWRVLPALAIGAGAAAAAIVPVWRHTVGPGAVLEDYGKFLWDSRRLVVIATLIPAAFVSGLPASLALPLAWGRGGVGDDRARRLARLLALGWVMSAVIYMLAGVGNARYAWPTVVFLAPLAACVSRGAWASAGGFDERRRSWARVAMLGHAAAWPALLGAGAAAGIVAQELQRARNSGSAPGRALGLAVPDGAEVWAHGLIESRPDVLLYAARAAREAGRTIRPRWRDLSGADLPATGHCLLLMRTRDQDAERERYRAQIESGVLEPVHEGTVYKYTFTLYRVAPARRYAGG